MTGKSEGRACHAVTPARQFGFGASAPVPVLAHARQSDLSSVLDKFCLISLTGPHRSPNGDLALRKGGARAGAAVAALPTGAQE